MLTTSEATRGALNERDAIGWAVQQQRPGDLTIVLAGSGHAVNWYADDALTPRTGAAVRHVPAGEPCPGVGLADIVGGYQRVLVYGYLKNAEVRATASQLCIDLAVLGTVVAEHPSGPAAIVLVVALRPTAERAPAAGCYVR